MLKRTALIICMLFVVTLVVPQAYPHCQIPCGIYDDGMRIEMIQEDITTVEKAMNKILSLSAEGEKNYNQIVRWVNAKDEHADKISKIATQYFMTQRLKPADISDKKAYTAYTTMLAYLHQLMFYSMKSKQTVDKQNITKMREALDGFHHLYHKHE